jgi:hypothetical protein
MTTLSPDTVARIVKYLDTHNGRDKIVRFIQYWSKYNFFISNSHRSEGTNTFPSQCNIASYSLESTDFLRGTQ